jgi:hypothetical protein
MASIRISSGENYKVIERQWTYNRPYRFTIMEDYKVGKGLEHTTSETFKRIGTHKSRAPGPSGVYILYVGA